MRVVIIVVLCYCSSILMGQSPNLANQYFQTGEYEKSATLYKKLYDKHKAQTYYAYYIESLINAGLYDEAQSSVQSELKQKPTSTQLYVYFGRINDAQSKSEEAEKYYQKAIKNLTADRNLINNTASAFRNSAKYELAVQVYEKGSELLNDDKVYAYQLADLYRRTGEKDKMVTQYLNCLDRYRNHMTSFYRILQNYCEDGDIKLIQKELYSRIKKEDEPLYYEVLEWSFLHLKQYKKALRQARSTDRRVNGNGSKVHEMGRIAYNAGDYDTAREAFDYILENHGSASPYYIDANRGLINIQKQRILNGPNRDQAIIDTLMITYRDVLDGRGRNRETAALMIDYANSEALINNNVDSAVVILNELVALGDVDQYLKAKAKLDLADYLLISGDRWEATLLYSQVDKSFQEAELGEIARFRNAMLSYYSGDFEWAQEQFDVLKRSTSRLIANDAIDMSVFIMDNLAEDTLTKPLQLFSNADLFIFQNKYTEAFEKLDSVEILFPDHGLLDDILYRKGKLYTKLAQYEKAEAVYKTIIEKYPEEIKGDNAIFDLAELYEKRMDRKNDAIVLYEKLFIDYPTSTLSVDARKRYRTLRGDNMQ